MGVHSTASNVLIIAGAGLKFDEPVLWVSR
jgi:hypothetical protein